MEIADRLKGYHSTLFVSGIHNACTQKKFVHIQNASSSLKDVRLQTSLKAYKEMTISNQVKSGNE